MRTASRASLGHRRRRPPPRAPDRKGPHTLKLINIPFTKGLWNLTLPTTPEILRDFRAVPDSIHPPHRCCLLLTFFFERRIRIYSLKKKKQSIKPGQAKETNKNWVMKHPHPHPHPGVGKKSPANGKAHQARTRKKPEEGNPTAMSLRCHRRGV